MRDLDDRRVARTRQALLIAFRELVFANGYENVTVLEIVARANVGRSTFYEHFTGKDEILRASMSPFLGVFAACVLAEAPPEPLVPVLDHLWSNRRLTDAIFTGPPRAILARALAQMIEAGLEEMAGQGRMAIPPRLAGIQLAEAQLALVEAWMRGKAHCAPVKLAAAFHATTRAATLVLLAHADALPQAESRNAA